MRNQGSYLYLAKTTKEWMNKKMEYVWGFFESIDLILDKTIYVFPPKANILTLTQK